MCILKNFAGINSWNSIFWRSKKDIRFFAKERKIRDIVFPQNFPLITRPNLLLQLDFELSFTVAIFQGYLIGPFSAGPFLTPAPLTPALIPPVLKMRLTPIRAGVKRATNFRSLAYKELSFLGLFLLLFGLVMASGV